MNILLLIAVAVVYILVYAIMVIPQKKRENAQKKFVSEMKLNDEVVTSSGIVGRVNKINDDTVVLSGPENHKIKVLKSTIQGRLKSK